MVFASAGRPVNLAAALQALVLLAAYLFAGCSSAQAPAAPAQQPPQEEPPKNQPSNRLANETSLYLWMHRHNPVDWYPWGEEALAKAKKENKPIFLSIGYSSCHWCHVMERESFLDKEIAAALNKHFVCIKVDREERPDIDSIYMTSLQVYMQLTGAGRGGGWPLSMFLTPDAKPFFGGTYFPARDGDRGAATGFLTLVERVQQVWGENKATIEKDADTITRLVKQQLDGRRDRAPEAVSDKLPLESLAFLDETYDAKFGGFGFDEADPRRPKFPEPSNLFFLIDHIDRSGDRRAREMLIGTLDRMAMGGIRDHLGGGFHRYSVDRYWAIPHFEKMLYDNGQLASVYSEAYRLTKRAEYRRVVEELLDFVLREMTDSQGGFRAALDAESEHEEGKFYRWEKSEVEKLLGPDDFALFAAIYGLDGEPNFEAEYYAPQLKTPLADLATQRGTTAEKLAAQLTPLCRKLLVARDKRPRPLTDEKILTGWNGLMIRGFADAGRIFAEKRYTAAAARAADFVLAKLRRKDGRLLRSYNKGQAKLNAYLDDYAFLVDGLIALYRASGDKKWLTAADELTAKQIEFYWDETNHGFYFTSDDHESLLARGKNPVDGAQPSGNSVSAQNLVYLATALDRPDYLAKAEQLIDATSGLLDRSPGAAPRLVIAVSALRKLQEKKSE